MAGAIDWKSLEHQFSANSVYREEIWKMLQPDDTDVRPGSKLVQLLQYASYCNC